MPPASEPQNLVSLPRCCSCYSCQSLERRCDPATNPSLSGPQAVELPTMVRADYTSGSATGIKGPRLHPGDQSAINLAGKAAVRRHSGDTSLFGAGKHVCYPPGPDHQGLSGADGRLYRQLTARRVSSPVLTPLAALTLTNCFHARRASGNKSVLECCRVQIRLVSKISMDRGGLRGTNCLDAGSLGEARSTMRDAVF